MKDSEAAIDEVSPQMEMGNKRILDGRKRIAEIDSLLRDIPDTEEYEPIKNYGELIQIDPRYGREAFLVWPGTYFHKKESVPQNWPAVLPRSTISTYNEERKKLQEERGGLVEMIDQERKILVDLICAMRREIQILSSSNQEFSSLGSFVCLYNLFRAGGISFGVKTSDHVDLEILKNLVYSGALFIGSDVIRIEVNFDPSKEFPISIRKIYAEYDTTSYLDFPPNVSWATGGRS